MVGVVGLEPTASWYRTMRDTKLRHTPILYFLVLSTVLFSSNFLPFSFFPATTTTLITTENNKKKNYGKLGHATFP